MVKIGANAYSRAIHDLGVLHGHSYVWIEQGGDEARERHVGDNLKSGAKDALSKLKDDCVVLSVPVTKAAVERLLRSLDDDLSLEDFEILLEQIESRLYDELESRHLFTLTAKEAELYDGEYFPPTVAAAFPKAVGDLEEASKCLALGRFTASVFHLMRAMECAVQALSTKLGIGKPDRVWGVLLSDIHKKIEAMPQGDERNNWSESHSHLYHVKQAWRNDVMHPRETYTADQAEDVFIAVRSFMRHLALLV